MDQKILDFLAKEKVSALSVCMPDGTCHNAAMHYSHIAEPLTIYIQTENTSKKMAGLKDGQPVAASVVVGFNEQEMKTLQMDGQIQLIADASKLPDIHKIRYAKHPSAEQYKSDPATVFLAFTPTWYRYTDYKTAPPTFIES
ncbi:MAG: hypothetical protein UX80_C0005G0014 [Candidatus Amesbacteria bacterium GW2011_GWA2_47_11b]|uniref:Pyridoxamine 5'-phosphate oxidase N-terminal domain-containing protein n=3 Tax=Candidatus Amesiibacteriota TaxID=1752730 RepID=A0A0G1USG5_9BACT|nr:MAG: hypothetical protein UX42_C0001G0072 [Microgenomates group bacterium GW2011_GWC1_46_20]KKU58194.1 MAG: hypothetical protein UX80_C0005G0014 [Candidatus Amesbacteria bacterium GW2011_GWA2_47_11b]KKU68988.1 MAG: hypothetical protein UX92_C0016G0013 [Candidatus Amesbacteria bacterium GW2011_GWA1_47_20]KKU83367.1 MAG: hypothetical protein UY11_C0021G0007 [Candidatus Amesbacteria bacterium GW2011_GWC2_47_8]